VYRVDFGRNIPLRLAMKASFVSKEQAVRMGLRGQRISMQKTYYISS